MSILKKKTLLYVLREETPTPPGPSFELPPSNTIWYEADVDIHQVGNTCGSPISYSYDSETGRGVLVYANDITSSQVVAYNAFKPMSSVYNNRLKKIWWPACCALWLDDCMHSNKALTDVYAGESLQDMTQGTLAGGVPLEHIHLKDNNYFADNNTGLVYVTGSNTGVLLKGTVNLDIRNTPCTTIGSRCMADMPIEGCTLYFPDTVTGFAGDWNIGTSVRTVFTAYFYSTVAPTLSHTQGNLRCGSGTIIHIPVGSLSSYQEKWANLKDYNNITFVEDL